MPIMPMDVMKTAVELEELCEIVAKLQKIVRYLQNGQIDFENIRARSIKAENIETETLTANEIAANSITADRMNVAQLSAIAADLGHITAGLVEAVNIVSSTITGSLIQTGAAGSYPRAEMNSTDNVFKAEYDAASSVEIRPDAITGRPGLRLDHGLAGGVLSTTTVSSVDMILLRSTLGLTSILIDAGIDLILEVGGLVRVGNWSKLKSDGSGQTLQQALDAKANTFSGYTGGIPAGASLVCSNGIVITYV